MINFDQISPNTIEEYYMCTESIENSYKDLTQYYFELFNE